MKKGPTTDPLYYVVKKNLATSTLRTDPPVLCCSKSKWREWTKSILWMEISTRPAV